MKTKSENAKYSRRAILKSLGIGAGFLPLLSTERSKAVAQTTGYPLRFIGITLDRRRVPAEFLPHRRGGPVAGDVAVDAAAARDLGVEGDRAAIGEQAAEPDRSQGDGGHRLHIRRPLVLSRAADRRRHRKRDVGRRQRAVDRPALRQPSGDTGREQRASERRCAAVQELLQLSLGGHSNTQVDRSIQAVQHAVRGREHAGDAGQRAARETKERPRPRRQAADRVSNKLGTEDKAKVQAHLELDPGARKAAAGHAGDDDHDVHHASDHADRAQLLEQQQHELPTQVQFMADLVAAAVICGKARSVTMDLIDNGGGNSLTFPWLNISSPDFTPSRTRDRPTTCTRRRSTNGSARGASPGS